MDKITVLSWYTTDSVGSGEPANWYRLDEKGAGDRLFQHLIDNAECDGRDKFELLQVTEKEWKKAELED